MSRLPLAIALLIAGASTGACDDPEFNTVAAGDAGAAASTADSGFDVTACLTCESAPDVPGPGCYNEVHPCQADPVCNIALQCLLDQHCYGRTSAGLITCGLPCASGDSGINASSGAAYTEAIAMFECVANGSCKTKCLAP